MVRRGINSQPKQVKQKRPDSPETPLLTGQQQLQSQEQEINATDNNQNQSLNLSEAADIKVVDISID